MENARSINEYGKSIEVSIVYNAPVKEGEYVGIRQSTQLSRP